MCINALMFQLNEHRTQKPLFFASLLVVTNPTGYHGHTVKYTICLSNCIKAFKQKKANENVAQMRKCENTSNQNHATVFANV